MSVAESLSGTKLRRIRSGCEPRDVADVLAIEEPLEIRIGLPDKSHKAVSITMRTPGHDAELAAGFLFTEGILRSPDQISKIRHCGSISRPSNGTVGRSASSSTNTLRVDLKDAIDLNLKGLERNFYTTSSCGVCGKSSIDALSTGVERVAFDGFKVGYDDIHKLPETLRSSQSVFEQTGGLHASALFDREGVIDILREDVGRHNALDKVIGAKFMEGRVPLNTSILLVSGRASFELVQKALMAGIPIMAAVGAPSSLAVELAAEFNMTLIGFLRNDRFNIYCGPERVI